MSPRFSTGLAALAGAFILSASFHVSAHHAFAAEFDADRNLDVKGDVTKLKWVNPHCWLYFDVKNTDGTLQNWGVEFGTPNQLANIGLTREDVKPGTEVRIKGYRSKNGGPYGYAVTVTLPDGRSFKTGGAQDAPGAQPTTGAR